jgi:hypothetical protein
MNLQYETHRGVYESDAGAKNTFLRVIWTIEQVLETWWMSLGLLQMKRPL